MNNLSAAVRTAAAGAVAGLVMAACVKEPSAPDLTHCGQIYGSFGGRVSGTASDTLSGCAYHAFTSVDGFGMVLSNGGPYGEPMVKILAPHLLLGSTTVGENFSGAILIGEQKFTLTSGSATSSSVAGPWNRKQLHGKLDVTGRDEISGQTVRIVGEFISGCIGQHEPPGQGGDKPPAPPPQCRAEGAARHMP